MSKIKLNNLPHPNMKLAQFNCDGGLHEKLEKYPFTKLFNKHQSTLILGKAGQGKTTLLLSLFSSNRLMKKVFDCVILFQPYSSRDSIKEGDAIFDVLPEEQLFNELTEETLEEAVDIVDDCAGEGGNSVIILDDVSASLKDAGVEKELKNLNWNKRHRKLSFFFLSQSYYAVVKDVRKMFNYIIVFKVAPSELKVIIEENLQGNYDKKTINELAKIVFDKKFNYLLINCDTGDLFKGNKKSFQQIIIDDEGEI
tara:strand:+ start:257 stop:1018 length:762 start_codon:yes stop_codon:yes gene_type:complete